MSIVDTKDSFEDWPWIILYQQLDEAYPGSQFVLTKRNPRKWIQSYQNMLARQGDASEELNEIRRILYGLPFPNVSESQLIDRYVRHNTEVEAYFQGRQNDLLIVNWEEGSRWEELCSFLSKELPSDPFPHSNKGTYSSNFSLLKLINRFKKILI